MTKPSLPVDGILLHPCPYLYEVRFCTPAVCFSETPNYNATEAGAKSNKSEETPLTNLLDLLNVPPQFPATNNRNDTNITSAIDVSNITTKSQLTTSFPSVLNQKATNVTILSTSALNISSTAGINISVTTTPLSSLLSTSKFNEEKSIETPLPFVPQNQATKTSDVDEDFPDIKDHKTKENEGTFDSALLIPVATQPPVIQPTFENVKAASPSKEAVFKLDEIATLGSNVVAKTEVWKANTTASVLNQTSAVEAETLSPNASIVVSTSTPDVSSSADHQMVYQEPLMSDKKVDVKEETLVAFPPPFDGDSVVISNIPFPKQFLPKAGSTADTNKTQNEVAVTTNKTLLAPIVSNISTSLSANSTQKSTSRTGSLATINSTATASPTTTTTTVLPSSTKVTSTTSPLTTTTTTETITTSKITEAPETVLTTQSTIPQSTTLESSTTTKVTPLPVSIGGGANTPILIKMVEVAGMTKDPLPQPYDPRNISSFQFERTTSRALPTTTTLKTTTKAPRPTPIIIREIGVGTTLDLTAIQRQRKQEISSNG